MQVFSVVRLHFNPYVLDLDARLLLREHTAVHLSTKAFDLLVALAQARPNVVSKEALQRHLWPDTFVVEANLSNLIAEVRAALGDHSRDPRFIRTVHAKGYAFCADAIEVPGTTRLDAIVWLEWGDRRFQLPPGAHVIGRDGDAAVRIDAVTVSRRHARLTVSRDGARLEDLESKNGTYHGAQRISAPVTLANGDTIRIGSVRLTFYVRTAEPSTETQISAIR